MNAVRYFDECRWEDPGDGLNFEFTDREGAILAKIAMVDYESKLWRFEVMVPEKYRVENRAPMGIVYSASAAKRVAELILCNTILIRG